MKSVFAAEYEVFLERLISARKAADVTQQELAERLKKPQSFVSKYERRERRLDVVEFVLISAVVGFDPCLIIKDIEASLGASTRKGARK